MSLSEVHGRLAITAILFTAILAIWAFYRFFRRQGLDSSYWGALVIAEILYIAQGILGAYLYLTNAGRPVGGGMHILYGVVAVLCIPTAFAFTRGSDERRTMLVYGAMLLFMVGILFRSMATGG
jgi:CDP-diglyceride synthetase